MSDDFTAAEIAEMLAEEGQTVTLEVTTVSGYTPGSGQATGTITGYATVGVLLPFSRGLRAMPGSGIDARDQQLLLAANVQAPTLNSRIGVGGKVYAIIEVATLAPKGVPLYHDCTVRGV